MRRIGEIVRIVWSIMIILSCLACTLAGSKDNPYSPPRASSFPVKQRFEFVNLFLRGKWHEASIVFHKSVDNFIQQDEFCAAAKNYLFLYNLFKYLSIDRKALFKKAQSLAKLDTRCRSLADSTDDLLTEKDRKYKEVLTNYNFSLMITLLEKESDPLFKSVYARKAALMANEKGRFSEAEKFLNLAYETDKKHIWTLFLIEDLKLNYKIANDPLEKDRLQKKVNMLTKYVDDNSDVFF